MRKVLHTETAGIKVNEYLISSIRYSSLRRNGRASVLQEKDPVLNSGQGREFFCVTGRGECLVASNVKVPRVILPSKRLSTFETCDKW